MKKSYDWVEGLLIPESAAGSMYQADTGPEIFALVELSEEKTAEGWPKFSPCIIDIALGMAICERTRENVTEHVVRWLPIDKGDSHG